MQAGVMTDVWKQDIADYERAAEALFHSMQCAGFDPSCAVPVDVDGELFNGSHRVACALALDIANISVDQRQGIVWAPEWGERWFREAGASESLIEELKSELKLTDE